ncbi:MAG: sensor histidine kinase [Desulfuromonadaceae bacterium]
MQHTSKPYLNSAPKVLLYATAFVLGALALCFFSYVQKIMAGYPQRGIGYIVPALAGGGVGLYIRILVVRLQQAELEANTTMGAGKLLHKIIYLGACLVSGSVVLCVFSLTQKVLAGYPLKLAGFVTPVLFGGASGLILGIYLYRNRQLVLQQKLTNLRLQQERNRLYDILSSIDDGLVVTDEKRNIELVNNAAVSILDISACEMRAKPLTQIFDNCTSDSTEDFINTDAEEGAGQTFRILTSDGSVRAVKAKVTPIHNQNIRTGAVVLSLHDTTEEYKLEQLKTEFMSTATHNLKTPITAISGYAELLLAQEDLPQEQQHEFLTYIYDKAWNLDHMIDNLLTLRRVEDGRDLRLHKEPCHAEEILEAVRKLCGDLPPKISFKFDVEQVDTILNVDTKKIYQALENIIDNAVKFSPEGGIVKISASRAGNHYQFCIQDEGIGMEEEELEHIFDRFYRAETAVQNTPGIGLGMSLVKQIVDAHGGNIEAHSKPHQGSTIILSFPLNANAT